MFWETKRSEKQNERIAADHARIVEDLGDKSVLLRFLWICIAGNALIWLSVLIIPTVIYEWFGLLFEASDKLAIAVLGVPFGFALFAAYCLCRLRFPDIEDNKNLESEMMASFQYQAHSTKRWFIWLFSITAGVINVFLLIMVNSALSEGF